jgi:hypothetical protein
MKKLVVAIIAFLYLSTSCGATMYLHYCMGKLVSVGFLPGKNDQCAKCGMNKAEKGKGCCHDEHKLVKQDKDQNAKDRTDLSSQYKTFLVLYIPYAEYPAVRISSVAGAHPVSHAPPGSRQVPAWLLHCSFLI